MIALICAYCSKEFMAYPSQLKQGRKACSRACQGLLARRTSEHTFNRFVRKSANPNGCWEWTGGKSYSGYGRIQARKGAPSEQAHRFSYKFYIGPIPEGNFVCHACDNPSCCNPAHLFVGTPTENMRDMIAKGRRAQSPRMSGEANPKAKLSNEIVNAIRASSKSASAWARQLDVTPSTVCDIRNRKKWTHLP